MAKQNAKKASPAAAPKKGLAARIAKQDSAFAEKKAEAQAAKAARPLSPGSDINRDAEFHFSGLPHNMPSREDIEKGDGACKRMLSRDLESYRRALKGEMPQGAFDGSPIDLNLQTHQGYRGRWKALSSLIANGDLAALEAWNGGLGIRMNSSSSKPLGRFHQCAILAMRAKADASAKRKAKKAEKNGHAAPDDQAPDAAKIEAQHEAYQQALSDFDGAPEGEAQGE